MKLLGISFVLIGCTLSGLAVDQMAYKRLKELEGFIYAFELLKGEIIYHLTPLKSAVENAAKRSKGGIKTVFKSFEKALEAKEMESVQEMWEKALKENAKRLYLNEEDLKNLMQFGIACGYLDTSMQAVNIELTVEGLKERLKEEKEKYLRTSKLTKSFGLLIGASISIFLI